MRLMGRYEKSDKFWLTEMPFIQLMDQGKSKKEALTSVKDAVESLINLPEFSCEIIDLGERMFCLATDQVKILSAFVLRRLREAQGLTIREVARSLGMKSHTEYARHESGKVAMTLESFNRYIEVLSKKEMIFQIA